MSKISAVLLAVISAMAAFLISACAGAAHGGPQPGDSAHTSGLSDLTSYPHYINLPDGRKVLCVYETTYIKNGGPSCDWEHAK